MATTRERQLNMLIETMEDVYDQVVDLCLPDAAGNAAALLEVLRARNTQPTLTLVVDNEPRRAAQRGEDNPVLSEASQ